MHVRYHTLTAVTYFAALVKIEVILCTHGICTSYVIPLQFSCIAKLPCLPCFTSLQILAADSILLALKLFDVIDSTW